MKKYERMPLQSIDDSYMGKVYRVARERFNALYRQIKEEKRKGNPVAHLVRRKWLYRDYCKRMNVMYYFFNYYVEGNRFVRAF